MTISEGQNIVDLCLQEYGTLDALVKLCDANAITLNTVLVGGEEVLLPALVSDTAVVNYFRSRTKRINTGEKPLLDYEYRATENDVARITDNQKIRIL